MGEHPSASLLQYVRLVLVQAFEEFKWGRDLTIASVMALVTLLIQFYFGIPENYREKKLLVISLMAPYVLVFGVHILWKVFTAPHKLHQKQEGQLNESGSRLATANERIKEMEEEGPEVMLSFFYDDRSREYLGISVHNVRGGTTHRINVRAGTKDGLWLCDFGIIPYMAEGETLEIAPKTMKTKGINLSYPGDPKFISFIRIYDQDMKTDGNNLTVLPVTATYENSLGIVFEQDFQIFFDRYGRGDGRAHMLKNGLRRLVRDSK